MHLAFDNVNDAFLGLVRAFKDDLVGAVRTTSRVGDVMYIPEPVVITYRHPLQRVLFNRARDANPFFHLYEALWMLAGRDDVAPLAYYNSRICEIAGDDGVTFNGAYGYRWRHVPGDDEKTPHGQQVDQLQIIVDQLRRKPDSRRVVLQMWNVYDDLLKIDTTRDCCCNTHAYFLTREEYESEGHQVSEYPPHLYLDMTVCNRSNDMILGMLGANVVHFSMLQEYLARCLDVRVGYYHQMTNNLHVYLHNWHPEKWLESTHIASYEDVPVYPLVQIPQRFDAELSKWVEDVSRLVEEPFLRNVAGPAMQAFRLHKDRNYVLAREALERMPYCDWKIACSDWILRRQRNWENRHKEPSDAAAGVDEA